MDVSGVTGLLASNSNRPSSSASVTAGLGSQDFLKLLITQLTNQDPLKPTDNNELLKQVSSIREIELSTTLTDSLRSLTGQQRFASASTIIGQYVTGAPNADGVTPQGIAVGVRFAAEGKVVVQLSDGSELPLDRVTTIQAPQQAGRSLVGSQVIGVDRRNPSDPTPVDGVVTAVQSDGSGETVLELDSGDSLRLRDVVRIGAPVAG